MGRAPQWKRGRVVRIGGRPRAASALGVPAMSTDSPPNGDRPSLEELTARLIAFRDARDWRQFHSLKNLILSLNLEASELLELTQWKSEAQFDGEIDQPETRRRLEEECADVLLYLLLIAERSGIDLQSAAARKIKQNDEKYPVSRSRGKATKYTDL